ncbi:hypothetical protein [Nitrospira sp. Nam80]
MMYLAQPVRKKRLQVPNRMPGWLGTAAIRHLLQSAPRRWMPMALIGMTMWGPLIAFGQSFDQSIGVDKGPPTSAGVESAPEHGDFLVAGFGFQTSISSLITIRTYQARTGAVLSEDSYNLNVREEAAAGETQRDRIFAGGIGVDADGQPRFLLRAYDALTGKFLWQGQLNLTPQKEERRVRPVATIMPFRSIVRRTGMEWRSPVQLNLSLRAVDPLTGRLVWEDRFIPGVSTSRRAERTGFRSVDRFVTAETIGHIFNLVVRTVDRVSGRFLWQDSFEDADLIERTERDSGRQLEPQAVPLRNERDAAMLASIGRPGPAMIGCAAVWNGMSQPTVVEIYHRTAGACPASPWRGFGGL